MSSAEDEAPTPRLYVEPPIPIAGGIVDIPHVESIILQLDQGTFRQPALLVERMLWNPRLRAVLETRLAGLIATEVRFEPSRNNKDGRRAAKAFAEDWPLIAPSPMRKQMLKWSLMLGFGLAQRALDDSQTTGRHLYKLRPYWPGFASWYWARRAYRIQTFDRGVADAAPPSLEPWEPVDQYAVSPVLERPPSADKTPWVISEPYGVNSYRDALVHAAYSPWFDHSKARRDQGRSSEKHGVGAIKAKYFRGSGDKYKAALNRYMHGLRTLGSEGVIPCELREEDGAANFDAEPFEFNGTGFQAISDALNANAIALAILLLGHNLTTEIKGGSYAAAGVADYIRDDKKYEDGETEQSYARTQLGMPWAMANYGDPGLAPIMKYVTDSPAINLQRAQTLQAMAQATAQLRANVPRVDLDALAEQFRLPMLADGVQVQVPPLPGAQPTVPGAVPPKDENGSSPPAP